MWKLLFIVNNRELLFPVRMHFSFYELFGHTLLLCWVVFSLPICRNVLIVSFIIQSFLKMFCDQICQYFPFRFWILLGPRLLAKITIITSHTVSCPLWLGFCSFHTFWLWSMWNSFLQNYDLGTVPTSIYWVMRLHIPPPRIPDTATS